MDDTFQLLRADIARLEKKVDDIGSDISGLKNTLIAVAFGLAAALLGVLGAVIATG